MDIVNLRNQMKQMTDEEIKKRIKEIRNERNLLKQESDEYLRYLDKKETESRIITHKEYEGKCFKYIPFHSLRKNENIEAFKIIKVLDYPNENYAECLTLGSGSRNSCWNENGILKRTIGLWNSATTSIMYKETDPKIIDQYKEISEEEFVELYNFYLNDLSSALKKEG